MSEKILQALMQLFAIITNQSENHGTERMFVSGFLAKQLNKKTVDQYLSLYDEHISSSSISKRGTSVKDSVRILNICKKINNSLTQSQKVIVLVRLFQLIKASGTTSALGISVTDTISEVFHIDKGLLLNIKNFILEVEGIELSEELFLSITGKPIEGITNRLIKESLQGEILVLNALDVNLYFLRYTGKDELFLNGNRIESDEIAVVASGSVIKTAHGSPILYSDITRYFLSTKSNISLSFCVKDISYKFPDGNQGIQELSFNETGGNLVGVMGSSGSGKTTLLSVISTVLKPSAGSVEINNINLHDHKEDIGNLIGFVPQDDLLFEELTIYQNLYYNAKLCFGKETNEEITIRVNDTIKALDLEEAKHRKVGNKLERVISGGQRKRLNIALELIREPSILFVDEPTTGLSSLDSENVMNLLKEQALNARLVFTVIHQPSSEIFKLFDRILFMDRGGHLIFDGNPVEAVTYFKRAGNQIKSDEGECPDCGKVDPDVMFNVVESKEVDEYGRLTDQRKMAPEEWAKQFAEYKKKSSFIESKQQLSSSLSIPSRLIQAFLFFRRDVQSKLGNKQYILINLLEAPLLAFILAFLIRYIANPESGEYIFRLNDNIPAYIFMCVIVSLFIGMMVSAQEIFKDKAILKRESFLNLSRLSYLAAKVVLVFIISAIQTTLFVAVANSIIGVKEMFWPYWLVLFTTSCFANVLSLNISATFNSVVNIYITIPLILIPQMILGGAMFSYDKLNEMIGGGSKVPLIAELVPSKWAYEALMVNQFVNNKFNLLLYDLELRESIADYKLVYYLPKLEQAAQECYNYLRQKDLADEHLFKENLDLLRTEVRNELDLTPSIQFKSANNLTNSGFSLAIANELKIYLRRLRSFYQSAFNSYNRKKEKQLAQIQTAMGKSAFDKLRNDFSNESLEDIVKKRLDKYKIARYDNHLVQLIDPIFLIPEPKVLPIEIHFLAPRKPIGGRLMETLYANCIVIWILTSILFITLYFDFFKRILQFNRGTDAF